MKNPFDLTDKNSVVTGCRNGIGQGMALAMARAGANIISFDRNDPVETRKEVEKIGKTFTWIEIDLLKASPTQLQKTIDEVAASTPIHILVNNAGICPRDEIQSHPMESWQDALRLNLDAVWYMSQAASKHMIEQKYGKIIITGSILTFQGGLHVPGYAASKHGVAGLAKSMANSLAPYNINVNVIAPGYIQTKLTQAIQEDAERNRTIMERIPANRWGTPEDIGGTCVFLASAAADYIHGAVISVDGGWMSR